MDPQPDDIKWIPESKLLGLSGVSRAALKSWVKSGLDLKEAGGRAAYGVPEVVMLLLFASAREHLSPKQMVAVWAEVVSAGRDVEIVAAARNLKRGERFDLVIDLKYTMFEVALNKKELIAAVRHPTAPRPVVVLDLSESVYSAVTAFNRDGNPTRPPEVRRPGRPRSVSRLRVAASEGAP